VIFVSGEPGIGKTTLTRAFADSLASDRSIRVGRGQCVDQYGSGEPYLPILEALTRLCRESRGEKLVEILHRIAPAWLAQMPSLVNAEDRARLQQLAQGTTQQRMLREMAEALEVIAAETPLVLYLEDLHWSDPSTLDLIATVARRNEPARLMIIGTYRPVEMLAGKHPLRAMKEELELHRHAIELRLPLLSGRCRFSGGTIW
jgi:predicted ATPase